MAHYFNLPTVLVAVLLVALQSPQVMRATSAAQAAGALSQSQGWRVADGQGGDNKLQGNSDEDVLVNQQRQLLNTEHGGLPMMIMRARSCRPAFEPSCDMYPYIRYWNRRFSERDCFQSPLRHPLGNLAPIEERKYVVFQPDAAQWNNLRMAAEVVIQVALITGRTLVLPAMQMSEVHMRGADWHNKAADHVFGGPNSFFDFSRIREAIDVITMEEFLATVAAPGLLKKPLPTDVPMKELIYKRELYQYLEEACHWRQWDPEKVILAFNFTSAPHAGAPPLHLSPGSTVDALTGAGLSPVERDARLESFSNHKDPDMVRQPVMYDADFHSHRAIYFPGEKERVLAVWYSYLYFGSPAMGRLYRRVARDRLRGQDPLMCAAGRVVREVHREASELARAATRPPPRPQPPAEGGRRLAFAQVPAAGIEAGSRGGEGEDAWAEYGTWEEVGDEHQSILQAAADAAGEEEAGPGEARAAAAGISGLTAAPGVAVVSVAPAPKSSPAAAPPSQASREGSAPAPAGALAPGQAQGRSLKQSAWNHQLQAGRDTVQSPHRGNPQTLGGDTRSDATYHAMHIRRRDFKNAYKETYITEDELFQYVSPLLNRTVTRLLYIATDETNRTYFKPFEADFEVRYLADYITKADLTKYLKMHVHVGFIEQMVCANAHTFIGTPLSTFSSYITRLRGFYRDDRYSRTYYTLPYRMHQLHQRPNLYAPFWAREWSIAHENIDDHDR